MNDHTPDRAHPGPRPRPTTQAAEGVPRLKWTLEEFDKMVEAGLIAPEERIELIGGELVPMSPKGLQHENVRWALSRWLRYNLQSSIEFQQEPGWRPEGTHYFEPDFLLFRPGFTPVSVPAAHVLLVIEIASSSLRFDRGPKALGYARLGVPEYWVIDTETMTTRVLRTPRAEGYETAIDVAPEEVLSPVLVPEMKLCLRDLAIPSP